MTTLRSALTVDTFVPRLTAWRNELVFILGVIASALLFAQSTIDAIEITDLSSWQSAIPALVAYVTRMFNTGPVTARERALAEAAAAGR